VESSDVDTHGHGVIGIHSNPNSTGVRAEAVQGVGEARGVGYRDVQAVDNLIGEPPPICVAERPLQRTAQSLRCIM
jgi:hypothetical protein